MSKEINKQLQGLRQELSNVELSIEQSADQGDIPMVEYYDEQRNVLTKEIKSIENRLN